MAFETAGTAEAFLLARLSFAGILAFMAVSNLLDSEAMQGYAASKGVPVPSVAVPAGSLLLIAGAVSIAAGAYPFAGALAVIGFLTATTLLMHDFWAVDGDAAQDEMIHFLKNVGLLGGALAFLALAGIEWPYAVGAVL